MQKTSAKKTLIEAPAAVASSPVPSAIPPRAGGTPLRSDIPAAPADEAGGGSQPEFDEGAIDLLRHLATVRGCDVWSYDQARYGRQLEAFGFAWIVKAKRSPPGHQQQPYFGIKISAKGRLVLQGLEAARRLGVLRYSPLSPEEAAAGYAALVKVHGA